MKKMYKVYMTEADLRGFSEGQEKKGSIMVIPS